MEMPANILATRLKSIGDILFTLPAIHTLRENFPEAKITFLTARRNAPLLQGFREVDETITLDRARFQSGNPKAILSEMFSLLRRLRQGKFSLVVDFQGYGETAWLSWWSGAPDRWGNVYGRGRQWAYTRGVKRNECIHHAEWNLSLLQQCGLRVNRIRNEFILPAELLAEARNFFAANHLNPDQPTLLLQPFTSTPFKNWPLEYFLPLARHFHSCGVQIIFGGGPADRAALEPVRTDGFVVSAGVSLLVSAGLAKLSTLTIGGDTGLLHLAVAMGKRVLMLMTAAGQTYPLQHANWIITPAQGTDVTAIPVADVVAATQRVFNESSGNVSC